MSKTSSIRPEYVDRIPKTPQNGVIYISEKYSTAAHNCCCGCGAKIVTPLKLGRWSLRDKGGKISLHPSIGNWSSACQSHYWIENNQIRWAARFTRSEISANRARDKDALKSAYAQRRMTERSFWIRLWDKIKDWF